MFAKSLFKNAGNGKRGLPRFYLSPPPDKKKCRGKRICARPLLSLFRFAWSVNLKYQNTTKRGA